MNTLEEDLNLTSTQYQTCVSILFVGYILGQIPSNMLLTKVRPSYWMSSAMALWAIVSALTAVSKDFTGLLLTRFFLGVCEAPYYPGALFMLASFYTRKEIATRISILYTGNILATAFAGLIALGIFQMDGMAGIEVSTLGNLCTLLTSFRAGGGCLLYKALSPSSLLLPGSSCSQTTHYKLAG